MIERLRKLGLSGYEANAYLSLLKLGDAEANEIAVHAKVPIGRIYGVLASLEESSLIRSQDTRPKRYGCVEPEAALERLSKIKQEEFKQKAEELETMVKVMASELSCLTPSEPERRFWTVATGDESVELMRESILGARKELLYFYASKIISERVKKDLVTKKFSGIIDALNKSLNKGVEIKAILNKEVDISSLEDLPDVKPLLAHVGGNLEVRLAAIPTTPFDIVDSETVLLQMLNPLNPAELFAVVKIRDTKLAQELQKNFFTIWEKAEEYFVKNH